jgi:hypothetical protein
VAGTDTQFLAFAEALSAALAGDTPAERVVASRRAVVLLRPLLFKAPGAKRGRKPDHDKEWGMSQVMILAGGLDGLPDSQTAVGTWLGEQFAQAGRKRPEATWCNGIVREYKRWSRIHDQELREKYAQSPELQEDFSSESDFLAFVRFRNRHEQKWLHDKALQKRFPAPSAYVASVIGQALTRVQRPGASEKSNTELAIISE